MNYWKAGFDDFGALIFAAYILISVYQALTKKPKDDEEEGGDEDGTEKPTPFKWDESIGYDAQGNPVKKPPSRIPPPGAKPPEPRGSTSYEPHTPDDGYPIPKDSPARNDPYGVLTGKKQPAPRPVPAPQPRAQTRPVPPLRPDPSRGLPDAKRSEGEITRAKRDTEHTPVRTDTRPTDSEHKVRQRQPEVARSEWKDVFAERGSTGAVDRASAARRVAAALRKAAPADRSGERSGADVHPGAELVRLLKNPRTVSAAILAAEVLGPPVSRRHGRRFR